jgi:hypothetical protein
MKSTKLSMIKGRGYGKVIINVVNEIEKVADNLRKTEITPIRLVMTF